MAAIVRRRSVFPGTRNGNHASRSWRLPLVVDLLAGNSSIALVASVEGVCAQIEWIWTSSKLQSSQPSHHCRLGATRDARLSPGGRPTPTKSTAQANSTKAGRLVVVAAVTIDRWAPNVNLDLGCMLVGQVGQDRRSAMGEQ